MIRIHVLLSRMLFNVLMNTDDVKSTRSFYISAGASPWCAQLSKYLRARVVLVVALLALSKRK